MSCSSGRTCCEEHRLVPKAHTAGAAHAAVWKAGAPHGGRGRGAGAAWWHAPQPGPPGVAAACCVVGDVPRCSVRSVSSVSPGESPAGPWAGFCSPSLPTSRWVRPNAMGKLQFAVSGKTEENRVKTTLSGKNVGLFHSVPPPLSQDVFIAVTLQRIWLS